MADREMANEEAIEILGGIRACYNIFDEYDEPKYAALSKAILALKAEPIKHGRWIIMSMYEYRCSLCGAIHTRTRTNRCPNCGARMDLIGEDKSHPFAESVMMGMDGGENG